MNNRFHLTTKKLAAAATSLVLMSAFALAQIHDAADQHFARGKQMTAEGNLAGAVAEYQKAIESRNGNFAEARNNLGMVLGMQGDIQAAIREIKIAIEQNSEYPEAHYNLGVAYSLVDNFEGAESELLTAIKQSPGNFPEAHGNLGILYANRGETSRAITQFKIAVEQAEGIYPEAHYNLGIALFTVGKVEASVEEFKDAIAQNNNFPEAHYNLAIALARLGKNEDAASAFEAYLKAAVDPKDGDEVRSRISDLRRTAQSR